MADKFKAKIEAVLDTTKLEQSLKKVSTQDITLKGFKVDSASLKQQLQSAIDSTPFTLTVGEIKFNNGAITNAGNAVGTSLKNIIENKLNTGNFDAAVAKLNASFQKLGGSHNVNLDGVESQITRLRELVDSMDENISLGTKSGIKQASKDYREFNTTLQTVKNTLTTVSSEAKSFATSIQVNTLDNKMSQFLQQNAKAAQQYGQQITDLRTRMAQAMSSGQGLETGEFVTIQNQFREIESSVNTAKVSVSGFGQSITNAAKRMAAFASSVMLIRSAIRIFKNMAQEVLNVDAAMTGLRRVTDLTEAGYERLYSKMVASAKEYGATLTDIIDATTTWVKLGFSADEAQQLGNVTAMYQHVTDLDTSTAVDNLVTAYKGFQDELLQLSGGSSAQAVEYVADIFDKLGRILPMKDYIG